MRQLYIRDRSTDLNGATVIHDESGHSCYLLAGKWGIRYDALSLYTMSGELLAEAKQLTLGLTPKFALYLNQRQVGTIGKSLGFFHELIYIRGLNWIVVGSLMSGHFKVFCGSRLIFEVEPVQNTGGFCSRLSVVNQADEPLAILTATIINRWARHQDRQPLREKLRQLNLLSSTDNGDLSMGFVPKTLLNDQNIGKHIHQPE
ncbi:hypothetical protein PO252_03965 [Limosilactobacillus mucosae]|uniref:LURP-one-related/scramblase family protein n=1 Tax=Limosilactobacillus mucosae TaxID=97478 RepID=UPI00233F5380|nr:hypothetical protein [Limosilactobacillus mucosae]MDC2839000.1 hypothetical protein [Limosilactobacillus mucosae]